MSNVICKVLFLLFFSQSIYGQSYKNLAFEGGGTRGIAYVGAISVLESKHIMENIRSVCGTSVGAIVASMVATGYTANEMEIVLNDLKVQTFNDGQWIFIGGQYRIRKQYGWYKGNMLENWMGKIIRKKSGNDNMSFLDLHELSLKDGHYKDLYVTATNLSDQKTEVFSWKTYPNMHIKTAVRASMSIPLYYRAVFIDSMGREVRQKSNVKYKVFVDGGIMENYPLDIFDSSGVNMETLGLKLERPSQIVCYNNGESCIAGFDINNFKDYISAFYNIVIERLNRHISYENEKSRTIYISTGGISPKVRRLSKKDKNVLYENGRNAASNFFIKRGNKN